MYVDESGDPGKYDVNIAKALRPSRHYLLTGVIIPTSEWRNYLSALIEIRRSIKNEYGLNMREELHGVQLIYPRGSKTYRDIGSRKKRIELYKKFLESAVTRMPNANVINVYADKSKRELSQVDIEERTWRFLIQRFDNFLRWSANGEKGIVLADETNEVKIRRLMRRMRSFNPLPSRFSEKVILSPCERIIEDPVMRNSKASYFIQLADLIAHALFRKRQQSGSLRKFNVDRLFDITDSILLKQASRSDPLGIVDV